VCPDDRLRAAMHAELAVDVEDLALGGADGDDQPLGNLGVGEAR
jgi:hypothetical protein